MQASLFSLRQQLEYNHNRNCTVLSPDEGVMLLSTKERILTIRLLEKIKENPAYAESIGIAVQKESLGTDTKKRKEKEMFELLTVIVFVWLLVKAVGLAFKLTWGVAKVVASILMAVALPVLIVCMVFVGGLALIVPIAIIALAFGLLKACV